ncbi:MAG TPA: hypothetical protein VLQ45_16515 [Thermoanaerobaculia bacterium]|jgi:hypothetical protein|nr:hypothetical protein [Thermoanaerobaculia bacterium]HSK78057.1 hypothetical protein [Thermoanaerobaculia bacterium]
MAAARRLMNRLYYFTIEDESILAESFAQLEKETYAITYKVTGTEDVFVTTAETKDALDRHDIPYNLLAEEDGAKIAVYHSPLSREELSEYEDAVKALALACRAIALACVGVNGESNLGFDLSNGAKSYTYFTAPAGHTFIWRLFHEREEAVSFLSKLTGGEKKAVEWAESIPLSSSKELKSYH